MTVEWKGDKHIKAAIEAQKKALTAASLVVQGDATSRTPVLTGNLKNSITYKVREEDAIVGTNVEYAPYVEFGTSKMAAQPFLEPSLHDNRKRIEKLIGDVIGKAIEGAGK